MLKYVEICGQTHNIGINTKKHGFVIIQSKKKMQIHISEASSMKHLIFIQYMYYQMKKIHKFHNINHLKALEVKRNEKNCPNIS